MGTGGEQQKREKRYVSDLVFLQKFVDWMDGTSKKPNATTDRVVGILRAIWPEAPDLGGANEATFFKPRGGGGGALVAGAANAQRYLDALRTIAATVNSLRQQASDGRIVIASLNIPVKKYLAAAMITLRDDHHVVVELDQATLLRDIAPEHLWAPGNPHPDYALVATATEPVNRDVAYGVNLRWELLYSWKIAVIGIPDATGNVTLGQVADAATAGSSRILVSPFGRAGRTIVDNAIAADKTLTARYRGIQFLAAQDTRTRVELAKAGYGIALAPVDALPGNDLRDTTPPPLLLPSAGSDPLTGYYSCVWAEDGSRNSNRDSVVVGALRAAASAAYSTAAWGITIKDTNGAS